MLSIMKYTCLTIFLALALLCAGARSTCAGTVWDESANGDLSNDGLSPTPVSMAIGSNTVMGVTGNSGNGVDRDYFKFSVPAGSSLSALKLLGNTNVSGSVSFIGMQPGPQVTVTPTGGGVEQLIALGHYGNEQIGTDLLPSILLGGAKSLGAGVYSVWVQETGGTAAYGFDFVLTPTTTMNAVGPASDGPLPVWAVAALGGLLLTLVRRHETLGLR